MFHKAPYAELFIQVLEVSTIYSNTVWCTQEISQKSPATFKVWRLQFGLWTRQPLFFTPVSVQPWLLIYAGGASFLNQTVYTILHPRISTGKRLNQTIPGNKAPRFMLLGWTACVLICSLFLQKSLQRQLSTLFFCHVSYINKTNAKG